MRVFVTGASGWVGSAVTRELVANGHEVLGLARSDASEKIVVDAGGRVQRGTLADLALLAKSARECDGVIHTAYVHDFADLAASAAVDTKAIEALGAALEGSGRPLIVSSGMSIEPGRLGSENDEAFGGLAKLNPRQSEQLGLSMAKRGVRAMVVRLPPTTHGDGDNGLAPRLVKSARDKGFSFYVGDGKNHWPAVHRFDAAKVYRLALEKGEAGQRFHAVGEQGVPTRDISEVIGRKLGVPALSKTMDEAVAIFGFIGRVYGTDLIASNELTQQRLGWKPTERGLIEDLENGRYFDA